MKKFFRLVFFLASLMASFYSFADDLLFTSDDFENNGLLPTKYTCDGEGISPNFKWSSLDKKAKSIAIIAAEKTRTNQLNYFWVVYDLPSHVTELSEGVTQLPKNAQVMSNSFKEKKYHAPCPHLGEISQYQFTLYVLDDKVMLKNANIDTLLKFMNQHLLQSKVLLTVYSRWPVKLK